MLESGITKRFFFLLLHDFSQKCLVIMGLGGRVIPRYDPLKWFTLESLLYFLRDMPSAKSNHKLTVFRFVTFATFDILRLLMQILV